MVTAFVRSRWLGRAPARLAAPAPVAVAFPGPGRPEVEGTPGFVAELPSVVTCSRHVADVHHPPQSSTTSGHSGAWSELSRNLCGHEEQSRACPSQTAGLQWTGAEPVKPLGVWPRPCSVEWPWQRDGTGPSGWPLPLGSSRGRWSSRGFGGVGAWLCPPAAAPGSGWHRVHTVSSRPRWPAPGRAPALPSLAEQKAGPWELLVASRTASPFRIRVGGGQGDNLAPRGRR